MSTNYSGERFLPNECKGEMAIEHYQRYQFARNLVKDKVVLDAACGEGYGSSILAQVAKKVVGLDIDEQTVMEAQSRYGSNRLEYVSGSVEKLPFEDNTFDVIISFETIEHVDEEIQGKFLKEIARVLNPNGILIMSTPNKSVYTDLVKGKNKFHVKEFYINEYLGFVKREFKYVEIFLQYPYVGYFIAREEENIQVACKGIQQEECRYIMTICSNEELQSDIALDEVIHFDNSMYYFLNARTHELDEQILLMKKESDDFAKQQEDSINQQKEYVDHLEKDLNEQRSYIDHLEKDLNEQRNYIEHLEKDLGELKEYIEKLEKKQVWR